MSRKAHHAHKVERSDAKIKRIESAYVGRVVTLREICERFGMTLAQLDRLREKRGWAPRGRNFKPPQTASRYKPPKTPPRTAADYRRELEERDRQLYGRDLDDVNLLRMRGFVVTRSGPGVEVGNKQMAFAEMRRLAARERRLQNGGAR